LNRNITKNATLIDPELIQGLINDLGFKNVGSASIREIVALTSEVEKTTGIKFIHMEMGVPGLPAPEIGINAEIDSLKRGVANTYPRIEGVPELKNEISRFVKLYLNTNVPTFCCIPTTGSTSGSFICFLTLSRLNTERDTLLFIDPGFPVHKQQARVLGINQLSIDVYDCRGKLLGEKLEEIFSSGRIFAVIYSNPNNPSWVCLNEAELEIIGNLCESYDVIAIEDLAYINMDFRKDYSHPGEEPYQPTISRYTNNYIILISSSKIFSYAGQRIAAMVISPSLYQRNFSNLYKYFRNDNLGHAFVYGSAYAVSAGVTHSAQYGFYSLLKAANDYTENFVDKVKVYGERAKKMKKIFIENGFRILYSDDDGLPLADGFYFTVYYPGFSGEELVEELMNYGISSISLLNTGSRKTEGIRACVSQVSEEQLPELEYRLQLFHSKNKTIRHIE
jgi:aspartate/methionine/tyrosine aminotransferase